MISWMERWRTPHHASTAAPLPHPPSICPECHSSLSLATKEKCPACGYQLSQAIQRFPQQDWHFTRVMDQAGVLTRAKRQQLLHFLEQLERRISPVALGIYITNHGKPNELSMLAHALLNKMELHHASFGPRDLRRAIEESVMQMRLSGSSPHARISASPWGRAWGALRECSESVIRRCQELFFPYPPPVEKEWMLLLVVDVQLQQACFSWGYQLDHYLDEESLTRCILTGNVKFRDKNYVGALKKVMRAATSELAGHALLVNRHMRRRRRAQSSPSSPTFTAPTAPESPLPQQSETASRFQGLPLLLLSCCLCCSSMPSSAATEAMPNPSAPKTQLKGAIAPPTPPATPSEKALLPEQRHAQQLRAAQFDQIFDPSHQLNELESDELRLFLQRCNANDACKLWLAVVPGEAPAPAEELLSQLHRSTQPALLLELRMGSRLQLDLAQRGKLFTEEELHQLNVQLQERLTGHHYPLSSLRSGLQLLHPILAQLPERSEAERAEGTLHLPLVQLQLQTKKDKQEEQLLQEALEKKQQHELLLFLREYALPLCLVFLSLLSCCSLYLVGRHLRRWRVTLLPTGKEERLSSPYGASVSPPVDYAKRNSQSLLG